MSQNYKTGFQPQHIVIVKIVYNICVEKYSLVHSYFHLVFVVVGRAYRFHHLAKFEKNQLHDLLLQFKYNKYNSQI